MATLTFVKRSVLPVPVKGKVGTCSVGVGENGSIVFSTLATKALGSVDRVAIAFDKEKRVLMVVPKGNKLVAKVADSDMFELRHAKKGHTSAIAGGATFLNSTEVFDDAKYDYKASGNQSFPVTVDEKNGLISFTLPKGAVAKRATTPRKKKDKAPATAANPGSTTGTPVGGKAPVEEEELILETA